MKIIIKNRKKHSYDIESAIAEFQPKKLAESLENVLSKPITFQQEMEEAEKSRKLFWTIPEQTGILLDEQYGELIQTECNCKEFYKDYFSCSHVRKLLMAHFLEEYGPDVFRGTAIERDLIQLTGVEDPFLPGILRRTSNVFQKLFQNHKIQNKNEKDPLWIRNPKNPKPEITDQDEGSRGNSSGKTGKKKRKPEEPTLLTAECVLVPDVFENAMELKVGPKHRYVINHQPSFLEAYLNNQSYPLGKNSYLVGPGAYTPEAEKLVDFFAQIYDSYNRSNRLNFILPYNTGNQRRYFTLMGREFDAFMEQMNGQTISVQEGASIRKCKVELEESVEPYHFQKEMYGASLKKLDECVIGCGIESVYVRQGGHIVAIPKEQFEMRKILTEGMQSTEDTYINDRDLPMLMDSIQTVDPDFSMVTFDGFDLEQYIREKPEIQIYLDYPQEGLISCALKAYYRKANKTFSVFDQKKGRTIRDFRTEQPVGEKMWQYFNAFDEQEQMMYYECDENELYIFLTETMKKFPEYGEVFISDALKRLKVRPVADMAVGLQVDAGNLLLSLHSGMMDRKEIMEVLSSYRRKKRYTRLKNGDFITFDEKNEAMWETLAEAFRNSGKKNPEAMKIPLYRALYMEQMLAEKEDLQIDRDESYRALLENVKEDAYKQAKPPASLESILRPYQKDGFAWMKMLKQNGFGGILADDMGLGKTLQVLTFLQSEKEEGKKGNTLRTLIVTPASLVYNWKKEIATFTPDLRCAVLTGSASERKKMLASMRYACKMEKENVVDSEKVDSEETFSEMPEEAADIYITSYDLLKRDIGEYEDLVFANQIIDEAQFIKNQNTQAAKAVRLVESSFRMALTGTPIENRLSELWSIFEYLMPGFLYKYSRFRTEFEAPVVLNHDEETLKRLREMIHPFILRRLKQDVLKDLPEKIEKTMTVALEGKQRKLYDAHAERLRMYLEKQNEEDFQKGKLEILAELTKLRQVCCGPGLFLEDYKGENAKQEACLQLIRQAIDGGHKVLVFSQFTKVLDSLGECLNKEEITYHRIDGSTTKEDRMKQVNSFQKDEVPVFCISLKAGGTGLNLTAADIVIHYDPWWNVAAQNQATDRTHRIGQQNHVVVYQLIAEDTIEQQIVKLQQTKNQLAEDVLSGEGIASILIDKNAILGLL